MNLPMITKGKIQRLNAFARLSVDVSKSPHRTVAGGSWIAVSLLLAVLSGCGQGLTASDVLGASQYRAHVIACQAANRANLSALTGNPGADLDHRANVQGDAYSAITGVPTTFEVSELLPCELEDYDYP